MRLVEDDPREAHLLTIIALHGFGSHGAEFRAKLAAAWPNEWRAHARIVYPTAPLRRISCYDGAWFRSWHDYFTAYGDRGDVREEQIDAVDLDETRRSLGALLARERRVAGRDIAVAFLGESQGACCAINAAMHFGTPVVSLYGQRYAVTPLASNVSVHAFIGGRDTVIAPTLTRNSLRDAKAREVVAPGYAHAQVGPRLTSFLRESLRLIVDASRVGRSVAIAASLASTRAGVVTDARVE